MIGWTGLRLNDENVRLRLHDAPLAPAPWPEPPDETTRQRILKRGTPLGERRPRRPQSSGWERLDRNSGAKPSPPRICPHRHTVRGMPASSSLADVSFRIATPSGCPD